MASVDPLKLVGSVVASKYEVERVVGEGGFSVVYRAMHRIWKRPVALKVFRAFADIDAGERDALLASFVQEGALLAQLSERSAAICQARDIGTITTANGDWVPYMVLEWLDGSPLENVVEAERKAAAPRRSLIDAVAMLDGVAGALAIAHDMGIAHRDVKPGNLFVLKDDTLKILDFGIAKVVSEVQAQSFRTTQGAVTAFTPAYGAPEQFSRTHGATGPWTDVYALALILLELTTAWEPMVTADDFAKLAVAALDPDARPTPRRFGLTVSDEVEAVFARAVTVSTSDRFQSAGAFWNALRMALGLSAVRFGSRPSIEPERRSVVAGAQQQQQQQQQQVIRPPAPLFAPPPAPPSGDSSIVSMAAPTAPAPPKKSKGGGRAVVVMAVIGTIVGFGGGTLVLTGGVARIALNAFPPSTSVENAATLVASPPPTPAPATCPDGMVKIPGGRFFMGSDESNVTPAERPAHQVTLSPYCIDRFEVTVEKYKKCSDDGGCKRAPQVNEWATEMSDADRATYDPLCNIRDPDAKAKHPINCVDWSMASQFCAAQGGRLPTEAEWEFAARGPDGRVYPWGDEEPTADRLNACGAECVAWAKRAKVSLKPMYSTDDGWATTAPVGSFPKGASRYGVEDVVGNVWEWTADFYAPYAADAAKDPKGPESGETRVIRGGAWNGGFASWVRPTFRYRDAATSRSYGIGFRCARSL